MDNYDNNQGKKGNMKGTPLHTTTVWAGRRRYYFDLLSTKGGDKYISITESRRNIGDNGDVSFQNQKIFLFKEDFDKFKGALDHLFDCHKNGAPLTNVNIDNSQETYHADDVDFDAL